MTIMSNSPALNTGKPGVGTNIGYDQGAGKAGEPVGILKSENHDEITVV